MIGDESFYDSLDEDDQDNDDFLGSVPLYLGETPKECLKKIEPLKIDKPSKTVITAMDSNKKSYLSMYYNRIKISEGSNTSRATCNSSPASSLSDLDKDLSEIDSDEESYYKSIIAQEMSRSSVKSESPKQQPKRRMIPKVESPKINENKEKWEMWRKRQSYGQKASVQNQIRIKEIKELKATKKCGLRT